MEDVYVYGTAPTQTHEDQPQHQHQQPQKQQQQYPMTQQPKNIQLYPPPQHIPQFPPPQNIQQFPPQQTGKMYNSTVISMQPTQIDIPVIPPNRRTLAWLMCLFCCPPLGVAAIIQSNKVDNAFKRRHFQAAESASKCTQKLIYIGCIIGIILYIALIILVMLLFNTVWSNYNRYV